MTENELFKQSVLEAIISAIESYEKNDLDGWELYLVKRRAELADQEIAELQAQINELREALEKVIFHAEFRAQDEDTAKATAIGQLMVIEELANEYLAKTAPQCLQEQSAEIAQYKAQILELKCLLNEARDDVAAQLDNYQQLLPYKQHRYDAQKITLDSIDEYLAKTAPQSMQEHDNEVIERCVKKIESFKQADPYTGEVFNMEINTLLNECVEAIRELKVKQNAI